MNNNDLDFLISRYIEYVKKYGEGINKGDDKLANSSMDEVQKLLLDIKLRKDEGLKELAKLFDHESESVRFCSAAHLINKPEFDSITVLNKIIASGSILGIMAEMSLTVLKNGDVPD